MTNDGLAWFVAAMGLAAGCGNSDAGTSNGGSPDAAADGAGGSTQDSGTGDAPADATRPDSAVGECRPTQAATSRTCVVDDFIYDTICETCGPAKYAYLCRDGPPPLKGCVEHPPVRPDRQGMIDYCCEEPACVRFDSTDDMYCINTYGPEYRRWVCHPDIPVPDDCEDASGGVCCPRD